MCVVRVNGRVAIRDNGDIIDHMAPLEWFAAPPAAPAPAAPVVREPLRRGVDGVCSRSTCVCEREGLGDQCIWLQPSAIEAAHGITGGKP
jgi:hypothetical protein